MRVWERWVGFVGRSVDARPLVQLKRLLAAVLVVDLLAIVVFDAHTAVWFVAEHGGIIGQAQAWSLGSGPWVGPLWWGLSLVLLGAVAAGWGGRIVLVLAIFAYAQFGHFDWSGDRGIDRICRTALLILACSAVGRRDVPERVAGWPGDLIRVLLVAIYLQSGLSKLYSNWSWASTDLNPLYAILSGPQVGVLDPELFFPYQAGFALLGVATLALELTAPIILIRHLAPWWAVFGALLHVGLALTMNLGIFPYAMLCFYVLLFEPWTGPAERRQ